MNQDLRSKYFHPKLNPESDLVRLQDQFEPPDRHLYTERTEYLVYERVKDVLGIELIEQSKGFEPKFDMVWRLDGDDGLIFVEVKTTTHNYLFIEIANAKGVDSGLSVTKAHFYFCLCLQYENKYGWIFKLRAITVANLKRWVEQCKKENQPLEIIDPIHGSSPGAQGYRFNFKDNERDYPHIWLGNFKAGIVDSTNIMILSVLDYPSKNFTTRQQQFIRELRTIGFFE